MYDIITKDRKHLRGQRGCQGMIYMIEWGEILLNLGIERPAILYLACALHFCECMCECMCAYLCVGVDFT